MDNGATWAGRGAFTNVLVRSEESRTRFVSGFGLGGLGVQRRSLLGEENSSSEAPFSGAFPTEKQWTGRYALELSYSSSATTGARTGCVQAYASGARQLEPCLKLPKSLVDPPLVSIALGVLSGGVGATGDIQLRFDDVVFTAQ